MTPFSAAPSLVVRLLDPDSDPQVSKARRDARRRRRARQRRRR